MGRIAKYTRRTVLVGTAAIAGGVAFGVYSAKQPVENPLTPDEGAVTLNPYLLIDADGVTIITPRAEMVQGIQTTLAALVAEELDIALADVRIEHGPPSSAYFNSAIAELGLPFAAYDMGTLEHRLADIAGGVMKLVGLQVTGGSTSTIDAFDKMRMAGAAARETLKVAASERTGVPVAALKTGDGAVTTPDGTRLAYTALAAAAAGITPPAEVSLRPPAEWRILGREIPRLDMVGKVTGTTEYALDIRLPGMKFATLRRNPQHGLGMARYDSTAAEAMPGVEKVIDLGDGIAVIANNTWTAMRAADAVEVEWESRETPHTTERAFDAITRAFDERPNATLRDDGETEAATGTGVNAEYRVPYLAHATMEPMAAAALFTGETLDLWSGNQAPVVTRDKAAAAVSLRSDSVRLHTTPMGGGFGRRAEVDFSVLAARVAKEVPGTPVLLTWSREEDMRHDFYRPAAIARFSGRVDNGRVTSIDGHIAAPSVTRQLVHRTIGITPPGPDKAILEGAFDQPYGIENYRISGYISDIDIPVGFWRSVGNSYNGFFHESFVDELAHAAGADPLSFRLSHIRDVDGPSARVLERVGELAEWTGSTPEGTGRGVAFTYSFGTPTAQIVEVEDTPRGIRLTRGWIACDVGTALDPTNIRAQMEGAMIFGLSAAIQGEITFTGGAVDQANFPDYDALRMHNAPRIMVDVLQEKERMGGAGEPGTPPSMPALANAIFDLTGERVRSLPLNKRFRFL